MSLYKNLLVVLILCVQSLTACQQKDDYPLASEIIIAKPKAWAELSSAKIVGVDGTDLKILIRDSLNAFSFINYSEIHNSIATKPNIWNLRSAFLTVVVSNQLMAATGFFSVPDSLKFRSIEQFPVDEMYYQDLWITLPNQSILLEKFPIHFIDKYYQIRISADERHLVCNPYNDRTLDYEPSQDGYFKIFYLRSAGNQSIESQKFQCDSCSNTFMFDKTFVFQRDLPMRDGFDGTSANIFESPHNAVFDTTRLATNVKLLLVSPDKKYALGSRQLFGQETIVMIDLQTKQLQYVLGREFINYSFFYSPTKKMFGFDAGGSLIYINWPGKFPFDALQFGEGFSTNEQNVKFWSGRTLKPIQD